MNPIAKKINDIIIGSPIIFQQRFDILLNKNYPFNINLSFSYSGNLIISNSQNSLAVTASSYNKAKIEGLSK